MSQVPTVVVVNPNKITVYIVINDRDFAPKKPVLWREGGPRMNKAKQPQVKNVKDAFEKFVAHAPASLARGRDLGSINFKDSEALFKQAHEFAVWRCECDLLALPEAHQGEGVER